jgi:coenzyme Q-binding protein COQ10
MFAVVADVEAYPQFVPLCEGLHVIRREQRGEATVLVARMSVGYKAIHESFSSRVTLYPNEPRVLVEYLDGPFRMLENRWLFHPVAGGTEVDFYIAYEFRSAMLGRLMGAMFDRAFRRFAEAFEQRARIVYGPAALPA